MKTLKTSEIVAAYAVIGGAKINKIVSADDKYTILMNLRKLKEVNDAYKAFYEDAIKALQGEKHDEMVALANKPERTAEESKAVNDYFAKFNADIEKSVKPEYDKTHELDLKAISNESFEQLIKDERNAWTAEQTLIAMDILC